jgi:hypothetical protein
MTSDMVLCLSTLVGLAIVSVAALRGWAGWLALKRFEMERSDMGSAASLIDMADMRERVRRLEAIAEGVEL